MQHGFPFSSTCFSKWLCFSKMGAQETTDFLKCIVSSMWGDDREIDLYIVVVHSAVSGSLRPTFVWLSAWTAACQASLSFTISQSLFKLMSIDLMMPSNHLILCCTLLLPSIFPASRSFSMSLNTCMFFILQIFSSKWKIIWIEYGLLSIALLISPQS